MRGAPVARMVIDQVEEIGGLQYVSGRSLAGEQFRRVLRVEPHGAAGSPPVGSIGLVLAMGGNRDQLICFGAEKAGTRPTGILGGETVLYNASGQAISIVTNEIRMAGGAKVTITADEIVLDGVIKLGGAGASRAVALFESVDEAGHKAVGNLATRVMGL